MSGDNDLLFTIIAVAAIMSLLLIVAAIGYTVGGSNSPRTRDGFEVEARSRTAPYLDAAGDPIPPRGSGPRRGGERNGVERLRRFTSDR